MKTVSANCIHGPGPGVPLEADCEQLELLLNQVEQLEADEIRIDSEIHDLVQKKKLMHSELLLLIKKIARIASTLSEVRQNKPPIGIRTYKRRRVDKNAGSPVDQRRETERVPSIVSVESLASSDRNQFVEEAVASSPACYPSTSSHAGAPCIQVLNRSRLNELEREFDDLDSQEDNESVNQTHAGRHYHPNPKADQFVFFDTEMPQLEKQGVAEVVVVKGRPQETNVCTGSEIELNSLVGGPSKEKRRSGGPENSRVAVKEEVEVVEAVEDPLDAHLNEIPDEDPVRRIEATLQALSNSVSAVKGDLHALKTHVGLSGETEYTQENTVNGKFISIGAGLKVPTSLLLALRRTYRVNDFALLVLKCCFSFEQRTQRKAKDFVEAHRYKLDAIIKFTKKVFTQSKIVFDPNCDEAIISSIEGHIANQRKEARKKRKLILQMGHISDDEAQAS